MPTPLRVLILEDRLADAELMVHELRQAGFDPDWQRVETESEYSARLDPALDLILSDYHLPHFNASRALQLMQARGLDIPFIVVTGSFEENALECMKQGAADYLLKDRLARLGPAVTHALQQRRIRREKERAEQSLRASEERYRTLAEAAHDAIFIIDRDDRIEYVNRFAAEQLGRRPQDLIGKPRATLFPPEASTHQKRNLERVLETGSPIYDEQKTPFPNRDVWLGTWLVPISDETGSVQSVLGVSRDITERKRVEEQLTAINIETRRRLEFMQALRATDMAILGSLDLRVTLNVLLDQVTTQLRIDAAAVLLLNQSTQTLECAASRGFRTPSIDSGRVGQGVPYAGQAALQRQLVRIPDLRHADVPSGLSHLIAEESFVSYYCVPLIAKGEVRGVLELFHRSPLTPGSEWSSFLELLTGQAAIAIDSASLFERLQRSLTELGLAYDSTLEGWVRALDLRDKETEGHTQRVTEMTLRMARALGISDAEIAHIRRGALLHDIGKVGIPDSILHKPGPLTEEEWEVMRKHPVHAHQWLSSISYLKPALDIPYCHHERWDGKGYPRGLKGEQIPLAARIFAVVDAYDAMTSERPYRKALSRDQAIAELRRGTGTQFDPQVVEVMLQTLEKGREKADLNH